MSAPTKSRSLSFGTPSSKALSRLCYLLDTDTVSFALRGAGDAGQGILRHRPSELAVSAITVAELRYGADKRSSLKLHSLIDGFLEPLSLAPFEDSAARSYGSLAAELARQGAPIGQADTMIAAHALALGLTLVTHNSRHFERVPGLKLENWF